MEMRLACKFGGSNALQEKAKVGLAACCLRALMGALGCAQQHNPKAKKSEAGSLANFFKF